jgi:hypothetical protein
MEEVIVVVDDALPTESSDDSPKRSVPVVINLDEYVDASQAIDPKDLLFGLQAAPQKVLGIFFFSFFLLFKRLNKRRVVQSVRERMRNLRLHAVFASNPVI